MSVYRQYLLLTALLLSSAIYAIYAGIVAWILEKFPSTVTLGALAIVMVVFSWTFVLRGHRTARTLAHNETALNRLAKTHELVASEARSNLEEAHMLREEGKAETGQSDFSHLHSRQVSYFRDALMADVGMIESVQFRLFISGVFLAFLSIVIGVGLAKFPNAVENLSPFLFELLKALGLAYVPGLACIGSFMILAELASILRVGTARVVKQFDLAAYRVVIIGRPIDKSLVDNILLIKGGGDV